MGCSDYAHTRRRRTLFLAGLVSWTCSGVCQEREDHAVVISAPLSLCCNNVLEVYKFSVSGLAEFIVKGKSSMREVEFDWLQFVNSLLKLGCLQWIGAAIFFWGWIHQRRCHAILGSLRDHSEQNDEYVIPHGDWFEIVSSPHYLAEMVIYAGLVVASGGTDLRISESSYPKKRLAIIPFVY